MNVNYGNVVNGPLSFGENVAIQKFKKFGVESEAEFSQKINSLSGMQLERFVTNAGLRPAMTEAATKEALISQFRKVKTDYDAIMKRNSSV